MIESRTKAPVSVSFVHRMRVLRRRLIPAAVWLSAATLLVVWAGGRSQYISGVGLVEAIQTVVAPIEDGNIQDLYVDIFDTVEKDEIIGWMNDTIVVAELAVADAKVAQLRSRIVAERGKLDSQFAVQEADTRNNLRRFKMNEAEAHLQYLEIDRQQEADIIKMERLRLDMERQQRLVAQDVVAQDLYDDARLRYDELKKEVEKNRPALRAAKQLHEQATQRRIEWEDQSPAAASDDFLAPIRESLNVQQARISEIKQRVAMLALTAPATGQVLQIFHRPGETVLAGDPILAIAGTGNQRVLAYVDARAAGDIQPGDEVIIRSEHRPGRVAEARVSNAGAGITELPIALRSTPILPEWGFPVLISNIPQGVFLPGERLSIRIRTNTAPASQLASTEK